MGRCQILKLILRIQSSANRLPWTRCFVKKEKERWRMIPPVRKRFPSQQQVWPTHLHRQLRLVADLEGYSFSDPRREDKMPSHQKHKRRANQFLNFIDKIPIL